MDKEIVVDIYKGILLNYRNECIWVSSNEVDEPGAYYTQWSKSKRDKYCILTHTHTYIEYRKMVLMNLPVG